MDHRKSHRRRYLPLFQTSRHLPALPRRIAVVGGGYIAVEFANIFQTLGAQVEMQNDRGETRSFIVSRIEDGRLTVDGNHPLAGKTLRFVVEVNDVRDATPEEIAAGVPDQPAGVCATH